MFSLSIITIILDKTATISRQDWAVCGRREPAANCAVTYVAALYGTCVSCEAWCDKAFITECNAVGIVYSGTDMKFKGVRC
jgi:hypothetical protein